jgi:hypothetical protein
VNLILFIFYLIFFSWLLTRSAFINQTGWGVKLIVVLFCLKVAMGVLNGWIYSFYSESDSWAYHREGLKEYFLLFKNPHEYFSNIFFAGDLFGYKGFFSPENSFWNDLKTNLIVKIASVFDILSFGNLYINIIIYNFLTFFGVVALYKVFADVYKSGKQLVLFSVILLPSLLFYSSSFHKEGIIIASIGVILYTGYQWLENKRISGRRILLSLFSFLLLFFFRSYIILLLVPAMVAWYLSVRLKRLPSSIIFVAVYVFGCLIFFNLHTIFPKLDLPQIIIDKQSAFLSIEKARSYVGINLLEPSFYSFCMAAPKTLLNALFRPFVWDATTAIFLLPLALETAIYEVLFVLFLVFPVKNTISRTNPFILFGLFFAFSMLIITGYIVPVLGAIVRYRSVYLPFILTPVICSIDWQLIISKFKMIK